MMTRKVVCFMEWVRLMNDIRVRVTETVNKELIYN